jgi:zinc protease
MGISPANRAALITAHVERVVLPNGLTILVRRDESAPVVAIVTYVKAGYFDEADEVSGIAHVLEHMFFKGTAIRGTGEIARETKSAGGYLNAHTIYDHTSYFTVLPSASFEKGLGIQADAYSNSIIEERELAKELEVIIQEAKRKDDTPGSVAVETLFELMHDSHRIRRWRIGREEPLRALRRDDMMRFYRNYYRPGNTILAIVGNVDPKTVIERVGEIYGALPGGDVERDVGPVEKRAPGFRYREWGGDIQQTQLAFGWRTPGPLDPDTPLLDMLSVILSGGRASRLYRAVRDRKLASSIYAHDMTPGDIGVFLIQAEVPPAATADAARAVWDQLRSIREDGIEQLELERARRIVESSWLRRLETMEGQANHLATWEALGDWKLGEEMFARMLTATREEIAAAARRWLMPDAASVVVYRPEGAPAVAADARAMQSILNSAERHELPASRTHAAAPLTKRGASATLEKTVGRVSVFRTATGVPILVRRRLGTPIANIAVHFNGGVVQEDPGHQGITTLMARSAVKGTAHRDAARIAEEAELLGGGIGVSVGNEGFGWSMSVPTGSLGGAIELLADVAQNASIPDSAFETERAIALAELEQLRDDMFRYPLRLATAAAFPGHGYGASTLGSAQTLRSMEAGEVREWHRLRVIHGSAVIGIVGDVDEQELADHAAQAFHVLAEKKQGKLAAPAWPSEVVKSVESREKAQTALALTFPAPSRRDERRFATWLISGVASGLGGRFFDELRDRQSLAYTVHAYSTERAQAGLFTAYIATSPEREETARSGLLAEIAKLREELVSPEELHRAQSYLIGTNAIRQQSGSAVLGEMLDAWLFGTGLEEIERHDAQVAEVTAEQMRAVAREFFVESRRVEGIVRGI